MADYQLQSSKFHKEAEFTSVGIIAPISGHKLYGETTLELFIENTSNKNDIEVQGKLTGSKKWTSIKNIVGHGRSEPIDISTYDYIRFEVITYDQLDGLTPKLIASAYYTIPDTNNLIVAKLQETNNILVDLQSILEKMYKKQEILQYQIEEITGNEIIGDL